MTAEARALVLLFHFTQSEQADPGRFTHADMTGSGSAWVIRWRTGSPAMGYWRGDGDVRWQARSRGSLRLRFRGRK